MDRIRNISWPAVIFLLGAVFFLLVICSTRNGSGGFQLETGQETLGPVDGLHQEDPALIRMIQQRFLDRPPPPGPLKLAQANPALDWSALYGQYKQASWVETYFKGKKDGFFLECGAADGESLSNTLLFEMKYNWTGILIEANPTTYQGLRQRHRNVFSLNNCLSPSTYPDTLQFSVKGPTGLLSEIGKSKDAITSQCLPLYSILMAIGNPTVHYLSLDVEGVEEGVLSSVPWHKIDVKVLTVEFAWGNRTNIQGIMERGGYRVEHVLGMGNHPECPGCWPGGVDFVFVKNGFVP